MQQQWDMLLKTASCWGCHCPTTCYFWCFCRSSMGEFQVCSNPHDVARLCLLVVLLECLFTQGRFRH